MKSHNRNTLIAAALIAVGGSMVACSMVKAADFSVTTRQNYDGGWTSTYRDAAPRSYNGPVAGLPDGYAPLPTLCDLNGAGGFHIVTKLAPGERRCMGAR